MLDGNADGLTENVFIGGAAGLGVISLSAGFIDNKIPMIICRALMGIGELFYLCIGSSDTCVSSVLSNTYRLGEHIQLRRHHRHSKPIFLLPRHVHIQKLQLFKERSQSINLPYKRRYVRKKLAIILARIA